jgi:hypothetical protein
MLASVESRWAPRSKLDPDMECEILPSEFVFPLNTSERWRHPIIDKTLPVNQVRVRTKCRNGGAYCDVAVINAGSVFSSSGFAARNGFQRIWRCGI